MLQKRVPWVSDAANLARAITGLDIPAPSPWLLTPIIAMTALYNIWPSLESFITKYGTSTIGLTDRHELYDAVNSWLDQRGILFTSTFYTVTTKSRPDELWYSSDSSDEDVNSDDEDNHTIEDNPNKQNQKQNKLVKYRTKATAEHQKGSVDVAPLAGTRIFLYKGRILWCRHVQHTPTNLSPPVSQLNITCLGRSTAVIVQLLKAARREYGNPMIRILQPELQFWEETAKKPVRPLSTVMIDQKQKCALVNDIQRYLDPDRQRWYSNRGIPYRRGYLLYGPPGTGKTSLSAAIAGEFKMSLYAISLSSRSLTDECLIKLFKAVPKRSVISLEDIDSAGITQDRGEAGNGDGRPTGNASGGATLSGLLNVLDGLGSGEGRTVIMTTNHIEHLDPALLRPGRVDMKIEFYNANTDILKEMFESMYTSRSEDFVTPRKKNKRVTQNVSLTDKEIATLAKQFADQVPSGEFTPAEIQGYLLSYSESPAEACKNVAEWVIKTREDKGKRH